MDKEIDINQDISTDTKSDKEKNAERTVRNLIQNFKSFIYNFIKMIISSLIIMYLWNTQLHSLFAMSEITLWQSLSIIIVSNVLIDKNT